MNISSFNFKRPKSVEEGQAAQDLRELRQKLDATRQVFDAHTQDGVTLTSPQDSTLLLQNVKTAEGTLDGIHRTAKDGSEDVAADVRQTVNEGGYSYTTSRQIALHKDGNNPSVLQMSATDPFGRETSYTVHTDTGEVSASERKIDRNIDEEALPFNAYHPQTVVDGRGALRLAELNKELDQAQSVVVNQGQQHIVNAEDKATVLHDVKTAEGTMSGVLRQGQDGSSDLETLTWHTESDGGMSYGVAHGLSRHHEAGSGLLTVMESHNGYAHKFSLNETTGQTTVSTEKVEVPDEFSVKSFSSLHPKTLGDVLGLGRLSEVEKEVEGARALFLQQPEEDGVHYLKDGKFGKDNVSGQLTKDAAGEDMLAQLSHTESEGGFSYGSVTQLTVHEDSSGREIARQQGNYGKRFHIDTAGQVTIGDIRPE